MQILTESPSPHKSTSQRPSALQFQAGRYYAHFPSPQGEQLTQVSRDEWNRLAWANRDRAIQTEPNYIAYTPDETPVEPRPATLDEAVQQMVDRGKASRPQLAGRLDSAAELVRDGRVSLDGDDARIGPYTITAASCTCADFRHRGGWCKHRLAVRLARHLVAGGFTLPEAMDERPRPIVTEANRRLIESGAVLDEAQRARVAYSMSGEAARYRVLQALSRGPRSLPADLARRAGIVPAGEVGSD